MKSEHDCPCEPVSGSGGDSARSMAGGGYRHPSHRSWREVGWARLDCINKQASNLSGLKTGVDSAHRLPGLPV